MVSNEAIKEFYKEVCKNREGNNKIILEPGREIHESWIEFDTVKWQLESGLKELIEKLQKDNEKTFEDKLIEVYEYICLKYIYDDNVLFFFRKDTSDPENIKYIACDWYGRVVKPQWFERRQEHNRRICYEFSRMYAKAINILIEDKNKMEACMVGDVENTHYIVGLIGDEYNLLLDQDNFNSIKDLTRLKLGLTLKGITILSEKNSKLRNAIEKYNANRPEELAEIKRIEEKHKRSGDIIKYFKKIIEEIKKHNLDSQGFMEYMRIKIEDKDIDPDKIWREVKDSSEKRYVRCLLFNYKENMYLIDTVEQTIKQVKPEEIDKLKYIFEPRSYEYEYFGG